MNITDIIRKTKRLADDDQSILTSDIQDWIDLAIDRINQALKCNIPYITGLTLSTIPSFDTRFHEILVNYCVAKYREGDSDYSSAQYFMKLFDDMLDVMQRDMTLNPSIRMDYNVLQLTPPDTTGIISTVNLPFGSYFDQIFTYQNDVDISKYCTYNSISQTLTIDITNITNLTTTDKITVVFENNSDLNAPPFQWWGSTGW